MGRGSLICEMDRRACKTLSPHNRLLFADKPTTFPLNQPWLKLARALTHPTRIIS